jgi:magnesium-transporting ATPase (P-type)
MNADLQKQLTDLLTALSSTVTHTAEWAGQQIPPLIQEKILFGRIWETVLGVLLFASVAVAVTIVLYAWNDSNDWDEDARCFVVIVGTIGFVAFTTATIIQLQSIMLVWFAPRLYIIEWLHSMVK